MNQSWSHEGEEQSEMYGNDVSFQNMFADLKFFIYIYIYPGTGSLLTQGT